MIYIATFVCAFITTITITTALEDAMALVLFGPFCLIAIAMFLEQLRFNLPMQWRYDYPLWDALLCRIESHRCISLCGSGCCWECLRCNPDSPAVKRYNERLKLA